MKRVFIIHGWGGSPKKDWISWLRGELEKNNYEVITPEMPDSFNPKIDSWVSKLQDISKNLDKDTYFIGHSIGCQAIMRFLEKLPEKTKIGGAIFVAGWFNLTEETYDEVYTRELASPWIKSSINFEKIKKHTSKFIDIVSDNDPYVSLSDSDLFKEKLNAKIIIINNKGHISGEDGVNKFPLLLNQILEISR